MKDDRAYLSHIHDAIARIESYVSGGREAFIASTMIQDAVIRNLEVIGEAVKNLSGAIRIQHRDVPWTRRDRTREGTAPDRRSNCIERAKRD